jgi:hypothetical protein
MRKCIIYLVCLATLLLAACTPTKVVVVVVTATSQANIETTQPFVIPTSTPTSTNLPTPTGIPTETPTPTSTYKPTPPSTDTVTPTPSPSPTIINSIQWYEAKNHIGENKLVCGPVVGSQYAPSSRGQPTFLNIGEKYPNPGRFTVVIWGEDRPKFPPDPEEFYPGLTICVRGVIEEYEKAPEIIASDPSQIVVLG